MITGHQYRVKAAELLAKKREASSIIQPELEGLAAAYLRLAEQAERNNRLTDIAYETTPPKAADSDLKD
jgi:hypothetical protein